MQVVFSDSKIWEDAEASKSTRIRIGIVKLVVKIIQQKLCREQSPSNRKKEDCLANQTWMIRIC